MNETQSRFMQNLQKNKNHQKINSIGGIGGGVFQNNFLLPKASPNSGGMMKTFYNSKQVSSQERDGYHMPTNNNKKII